MMRTALFVALLAAAVPAAACDPVEGLAPLLQPGSVLLLGEMHGNAQSEAFVSRAACLAAAAGHPVTVALEIPVQEQERIAAFLDAAGVEKDRKDLLAGPFWTREYQDGRSSQAMLCLLDDLRTLRRSGRTVRVALLDTTVPPADGRSRDRVMADNLKAAYDAHPQDVFLSLTGNLHSRVTLGSPWNPKYEPTGWYFTQAKPDVKVTALDEAYSGGATWICQGADAAGCKAQQVKGSGDDKGVRVILHPLADGYHGVYNVGPLTASLPAGQPVQSVPK